VTELLNRIVLLVDGQRTFEELRETFREANLQRIRRTLRAHDVVRYRKDGTVAGRVVTGLMTDAPAGLDHRTVGDWRRSGGAIPEFTEEFRVVEGAGLYRELSDLLRDANAMRLHEGVIYPNDNPEGETNADQLRGGGDNSTRDPGTTA